MIDFISFIFYKMLALIGLLAVFGFPALIGHTLVWGLVPNNRVACWFYWIPVGSFVGMAYILFAAWAWPFGVPRTTSVEDHLTGALWNVVTENMQEHLDRQKKAKSPTRTELGTEIRRFELVSWNPPKHFYVTLKDVQTGQRYEGQYVSKHCLRREGLKHGEQYNLIVRYYALSSKPGERFMEFTNLRSAFCGD